MYDVNINMMLFFHKRVFNWGKTKMVTHMVAVHVLNSKDHINTSDFWH